MHFMNHNKFMLPSKGFNWNDVKKIVKNFPNFPTWFFKGHENVFNKFPCVCVCHAILNLHHLILHCVSFIYLCWGFSFYYAFLCFFVYLLLWSAPSPSGKGLVIYIMFFFMLFNINLSFSSSFSLNFPHFPRSFARSQGHGLKCVWWCFFSEN